MWIGPKEMPKWMIETWKVMNLDWKHMLWTEDTLAEHFPNKFKNQKHIDEHQDWCGKCDIMRYEILYKYGGFFPDADCICTNSLDDHFLEHDFFACFENEKMRPGLIAVGYMGAIKNCELMKICRDELYCKDSLDKNITGLMSWQMTGPLFLTKTIEKYKYPAHVYPSYVFIPRHFTGEQYTGSEKSYSDQFWSSTLEQWIF